MSSVHMGAWRAEGGGRLGVWTGGRLEMRRTQLKS